MVLPLAALTLLYAVGWWRLTRRGARRGWRPAAGLVRRPRLPAALVTPVAALAHFLFVAHMAQHMLLMAVVAPLLLLSNPFPAALWALPRPRGWSPGDCSSAGARCA